MIFIERLMRGWKHYTVTLKLAFFYVWQFSVACTCTLHSNCTPECTCTVQTLHFSETHSTQISEVADFPPEAPLIGDRYPIVTNRTTGRTLWSLTRVCRGEGGYYEWELSKSSCPPLNSLTT